ncbi:hypothetical protein CSA08_01980 [Candidatus Gracilibacteria bacterium]|nr:MAG: hypothetical protein CSA08_01980 [Candidatus Gracilibacteria bacterium]
MIIIKQIKIKLYLNDNIIDMDKNTLSDFIYKNTFYMNFIDMDFTFRKEDFKIFINEINELSEKYIHNNRIDSDFVSFLLDIESQLLMGIYEDKNKHKFIGISNEDGYQLIYDFIFFLIDFVSGKRTFEDFTNYIYEEYDI